MDRVLKSKDAMVCAIDTGADFAKEFHDTIKTDALDIIKTIMGEVDKAEQPQPTQLEGTQ